MRITIICMGSRGDVQPFVGLGVGLRRAGHDVRVATDVAFEELIRSHGLGFHPAAGDVRRAVEGDFARKLIDEGGNPLKLLRLMSRYAEEHSREMARSIMEASQGADLLLGGGAVLMVVSAAAEKLGIPIVVCQLYPLIPTRDFPSPLLPPPPFPLGGALNRASHRLLERVFWRLFRRGLDIARREVLGLSPAPVKPPPGVAAIPGALSLHGYSAHLVPRPRDYDPSIHLTGYWFLDAHQDWQPPVELREFLATGPPPVCVGFGSMKDRDPEGMTDLVLEALEKARLRGVLIVGWGGMARRRMPETVLQLDSAPHDWLFPRMAAIVHHGGAGTTAAGLRSGVPSVVVPFFGDQPFWAWRVFRAGVGPRPIRRKRLNARRLAAALVEAVHNPGLRRRAAELGEHIRAEDGVRRAVELVERHATTLRVH